VGRKGGGLAERVAGRTVCVVGAGSGLGAVAFRYLIYFFTWLATGHDQFGQAGYADSSHLPWLGLGFFVLIAVTGGLIYGPLIHRYARAARGHGVPEVMIAVAENGGRIRPQVSVVKAVASAICIGVGGSVGREGPIVQIGSALASGLGQWVKMPENPFLGDRPFLSGFPVGIALHHPRNYLLVAVLAVIAALIGPLFKTVVYKMEDLWRRPAGPGILPSGAVHTATGL
jgi:chloride channel protein, CIC family